MLKRLKKLFAPTKNPAAHPCRIVPAHEHGLHVTEFSANAVRIIDKLQQQGFSAYLVGGGVRDLLLRGKPKDFDVATNATPEQVKQLFRSAMIIGRRFRIVHVRFGREIIEVTTFRAHHDQAGNPKDAEQSLKGMLLRDNVYGDIQSDAWRRDFSVNALYYNPSNGELLDYTGGLGDLQHRTLTMIGDPEARYREDPVRMLRAVRFAAKLGFRLAANTEAPIPRLASLMRDVPPARLFEEVLKLMLGGHAAETLNQLRHYGLFEHLFPGTEECLEASQQVGDSQPLHLVEQAAINTDKRIHQGKKVTPAFIYAVFLWLPLQAAMRKLIDEQNLSESDAMQIAAQGVVGQQLSHTALPKRFLIPMREIWALQPRLTKRDGRRAFSLVEHPRFRAAYDFLLLREESGEDLQGLGEWWTRFQEVDEETRQEMARQLQSAGPRQRRNRRPRTRRSAAHSAPNP